MDDLERGRPGRETAARRWMYRLIQAAVLVAALLLYVIVVTRGHPMRWVGR